MSEPRQIIKQSFLLQEFLAEREAILQHMDAESERAGHDIGFERAVVEWVRKHREVWRAHRLQQQGQATFPPPSAASLLMPPFGSVTSAPKPSAYPERLRQSSFSQLASEESIPPPASEITTVITHAEIHHDIEAQLQSVQFIPAEGTSITGRYVSVTTSVRGRKDAPIADLVVALRPDYPVIGMHPLLIAAAREACEAVAREQEGKNPRLAELARSRAEPLKPDALRIAPNGLSQQWFELEQSGPAGRTISHACTNEEGEAIFHSVLLNESAVLRTGNGRFRCGGLVRPDGHPACDIVKVVTRNVNAVHELYAARHGNTIWAAASLERWPHSQLKVAVADDSWNGVRVLWRIAGVSGALELTGDPALGCAVGSATVGEGVGDVRSVSPVFEFVGSPCEFLRAGEQWRIQPRRDATLAEKAMFWPVFSVLNEPGFRGLFGTLHTAFLLDPERLNRAEVLISAAAADVMVRIGVARVMPHLIITMRSGGVHRAVPITRDFAAIDVPRRELARSWQLVFEWTENAARRIRKVAFPAITDRPAEPDPSEVDPTLQMRSRAEES